MWISLAYDTINLDAVESVILTGDGCLTLYMRSGRAIVVEPSVHEPNYDLGLVLDRIRELTNSTELLAIDEDGDVHQVKLTVEAPYVQSSEV